MHIMLLYTRFLCKDVYHRLLVLKKNLKQLKYSTVGDLIINRWHINRMAYNRQYNILEDRLSNQAN